VYYKPVGASAEDLRQMRRIDELHLELPFAGARMLRDLLLLEGFRIGRKRVGTLMRITAPALVEWARASNGSRPLDQCDANEGLKDRFFGATEVDEGRPLDVGRQRQASNQAVRLGSKDLGREQLLKSQR
jgi:helix-turn-helix protein